MAPNLISKGHNSRKIRNSPSSGSTRSKINHAPDDRDAKHVHVLEILEDLIQTYSETLILYFLSSGCPFHVYAEEVAEKSSGQVDRETTKKEDKHRSPFDGVHYGPEENLFTKTVAKHSKCEGRLLLDVSREWRGER
jgi:hypothetical protein